MRLLAARCALICACILVALVVVGALALVAFRDDDAVPVAVAPASTLKQPEIHEMSNDQLARQLGQPDKAFPGKNIGFPSGIVCRVYSDATHVRVIFVCAPGATA